MAENWGWDNQRKQHHRWLLHKVHTTITTTGTTITEILI